MLSKEQIDKLEELAAEATPYISVCRIWPIHLPVAYADSHFSDATYADLDYISAANPAVVLELIAMLREAQKDAARYRWFRENDPNQIFEVSTNERVIWLHETEVDHAIDVLMQRDCDGSQHG